MNSRNYMKFGAHGREAPQQDPFDKGLCHPQFVVIPLLDLFWPPRRGARVACGGVRAVDLVGMSAGAPDMGAG
jgi:hypothetical protein